MNSDAALLELRAHMKIDPEKIAPSIEDLIRSHVKKLEREGVILGLSGGLDSAVAAALCARAVGPENTLGLLMPDRDSEKSHIRDAVALAKELGIETKRIDLSPFLKEWGVYKLFFLNRLPLPRKLKGVLTRKAHGYFQRKTGETPFSAGMLGCRHAEFGDYLKNSSAYYRIKHRVRMVLIYLHAERGNRLVVGAANKTEYRIGFFVKYGCDHAADVMPLITLYKTQVKRLARFLDVPSSIVEKAPSPDLIPGITDEAAIGIPYAKLDMVLLALEKGREVREIAEMLGMQEDDVELVKGLTEKSEHMRNIFYS